MPITRHNQRLQRIAQSGHVMQSIGLPLLTSQFPMGLAAEELGADPRASSLLLRPDLAEPHALGPGQRCCCGVRIMLCIQPVGASIRSLRLTKTMAS